jgi:hypothetical protein
VPGVFGYQYDSIQQLVIRLYWLDPFEARSGPKCGKHNHLYNSISSVNGEWVNDAKVGLAEDLNLQCLQVRD